MANIAKCARCGNTAYVMTSKIGRSNGDGNRWKPAKHNYYVRCDCGNFGEFCPSSRAKAISKWNNKQKKELKNA